MNGDARDLPKMGRITVKPILACSMNAPQEKQACFDRLKAKLLAERADLIRRLQAFDVDSFYVITIEQKTNYEGNYVAFLRLRERGSDTTKQWKLLLKRRNGSWIIAEKKETPIN